MAKQTPDLPEHGPVVCPNCDKKHQWVQKFAGMRVGCTRCKQAMVMPYLPPAPPRAPLPSEAPAAASTEDSGLKLLDESSPSLPAQPQTKPAPASSADDDSIPLAMGDDAPAAAESPPAETNFPLDSTADASPAVSSDDLYELDMPDELVSAGPVEMRQCPHCETTIHPNTVICMACGTNVETGEKMNIQTSVEEKTAPPAASGRPMLDALATEKRRDEDAPNYMLEDIYVPIGFIVAGVLLILFNVFAVADMSLYTDDTLATENAVRTMMIVRHAVGIVFQIPFLFAGIFAIGMLFGTSFSGWTEVILKLAALAIFLSGLGGCVESFMDRITEGFGAFMWYITAFIKLGIFWGLAMKLFDLDAVETLILWFVAFFAPAIGVFYFFTVMYATLFA